jgi:glycosyltransferase involved in cell wall biosynthesis
MLSEFYPPLIGGTERHVQTLARELVRRGHHVAVATLMHRGFSAFEDDEGIRVYRISGWNRVLARFYQDEDRQFHPPAPDPGVMAGLRRIVEQEQPDIVHARKWILYSFIGLKTWSKAKLVVTMHDYSLFCPTVTYLHHGEVCTGPGYLKCIKCGISQYGKAKSLLMTNGLKFSNQLPHHVDKYIAVSSAVREAYIKGAGKRAEPVEVVPTFIPDNVLDEANMAGRPAFLPPEDNYLLFVGKESPLKGIDVLLEAYEGLSDLAPLVLMLSDFGDTSRAFPEGVIVVRNVSHAQVMAGWKHCAIGVIPSVWPEPFGQVIVEAMACGKPVVASAIGGIPDIVLDGESGLLVKPNDASALREALRTLLLDPDRRAQMGKIGQKRAHLFTVGVVADRIEQIYTELLNPEIGYGDEKRLSGKAGSIHSNQ